MFSNPADASRNKAWRNQPRVLFCVGEEGRERYHLLGGKGSLCDISCLSLFNPLRPSGGGMTYLMGHCEKAGSIGLFLLTLLGRRVCGHSSAIVGALPLLG